MPKEDFNLKTEYEKLKKKYKDLPSFDDINIDFELTAIDKPEFLSRQIRRRLNDKVIFFCRIIENIIYPSVQSTIGAYEASFFSEDERKNLVGLHKKLMILERKFLLYDVEASGEDNDIKLIKSLVSQWPSFKKELSKIVSKMGDSWQKELKEEGEKYFG